MFDMKAEIGLTLQSEEGPKKIVVRYPSDEQFMDWRRKKKVVQKDLGRRSFKIDPAKPEPADLALLNAIRVDKDGPSIDEAEAYHIIGQLSECEVLSRPDREGASYIVKMKIMRKLMTAHTLRIPSVKERMDYQRDRSSVIFGQYGQQEIRINLRAAGDLYDKLKVAVTGYQGAIPVAHKAEIVNVLLQEIDAEQEEVHEDDDEQD